MKLHMNGTCVFFVCVLSMIYGCISLDSTPNSSSYSCHDFSDDHDLNLTTEIIWGDLGKKLEVIFTNLGQGAVNVSGFLPWGFTNPEISLTDPKGMVYNAMDVRNITIIIKSKLLDSGESLSRTYNLLGFWKKGVEKTRVPGNEVFSEVGIYTLNVNYSPFMQDPNQSKVDTVFKCQIAFQPQTLT